MQKLETIETQMDELIARNAFLRERLGLDPAGYCDKCEEGLVNLDAFKTQFGRFCVEMDLFESEFKRER